jgi:hypothetical protein
MVGMGCETSITGSSPNFTITCSLDGCSSCYVQEFFPPQRPNWKTCICTSGGSNMQCCHLVLFNTSDESDPPYPLPDGDCDATGCGTSGNCVMFGSGSAGDPWRTRCDI